MNNHSQDLSILSSGSSAQEGFTVPVPARRWKTRVLLPVTMLAIFVGLLAYAARNSILPAQKVQVAPVVSKQVGQGLSAGGVVLQGAGWIEPEPFPIHVSSLADGIVREVSVLEGQMVQRGQVIAELVDDDARLELARTEAELNSAKAALEAAEQEWENPVERSRAVAVAQATLAETVGELKKVAADILVETGKLSELRDQLQREERAGAAISSGQVAQTRLKCATQEASVEAIKGRQEALEGSKLRHEAEVKAAEGHYRLRILERKVLAQARAEADRASTVRNEAKLRLERMQIKAPVAGVVLQRFVAPGSKLVRASDVPEAALVVTLYDPKHIQVRVDVPQAEASKVSVGQEARITLDAFRDKTLKGKVTRLVGQADIQKNTVQVKVSVSEPLQELKPDMLARVQFLAEATPTASSGLASAERVFAPLAVLKDAREGSEIDAWVIDKGNKAAMKRRIVIGTIRNGAWIEVSQGLQPGDLLIAGDPTGLRDGTRVEIAAEFNVGE